MWLSASALLVGALSHITCGLRIPSGKSAQLNNNNVSRGKREDEHFTHICSQKLGATALYDTRKMRRVNFNLLVVVSSGGLVGYRRE